MAESNNTANGGGKPAHVTKEDLVEFLTSGCTPKSNWRSVNERIHLWSRVLVLSSIDYGF